MKQNAVHLEEFGNLQGTGRTSTDIGVILDAAFRGKVDMLFLADGAEQWGIFNTDNGKVAMHDRQEDQSEELLGLAATHTLAHRGRVMTVDAASMPEKAAVAAILRF